MGEKLKKIDIRYIKNSTYYFFEGKINIKHLDPNKTNTDKKL